jgi:tRNA G18 (ribose-2'-O)-methylase SpoU
VPATQYTSISTGEPWGGGVTSLPQALAKTAVARSAATATRAKGRAEEAADISAIVLSRSRIVPAVTFPAQSPVEVTNPDDPRLADYRALKERHLNAQGGRFVAESERVVRRLLASPLGVWSVLVTPPRLRALEDALAARASHGPDRPPPVVPEVFVASQAVIDAIAGFHVHRGCLAIGERPAARALPPGARGIIVLEDLVDVDNLGAIVRNATAFGVDALVLSPRCADPFYRKAIRVSLGAVFDLPVVRLEHWPQDLDLLRRLGFSLVAAVLAANATPLPRFTPPKRWALLLGAEGPGLSPEAVLRCHERVTIPMSTSNGVDSLNVATAAAVMLYALTR